MLSRPDVNRSTAVTAHSDGMNHLPQFFDHNEDVSNNPATFHSPWLFK